MCPDDLGLGSVAVSCAAYRRSEDQSSAPKQPSDAFLTNQKFCLADALAQLTQSLSFSLSLCKVTNRASEDVMATRRWTENMEVRSVELRLQHAGASKSSLSLFAPLPLFSWRFQQTGCKDQQGSSLLLLTPANTCLRAFKLIFIDNCR